MWRLVDFDFIIIMVAITYNPRYFIWLPILILLFNRGCRDHFILCGSLNNFDFILIVVVINHVTYVVILSNFDFIFSMVVINYVILYDNLKTIMLLSL